ncbi:unnamed protein product [Leptosia nina]|uniref:Uncharacterized protein n=1 Tax=Leptosia nina TaxID=320188 RepID=A0AAV1J712_9NEOP
MCFGSTRRWVVILVIIFCRRVNVQFAYPVFMPPPPPPPPMLAMPPPMPIPIIAIEIPEFTTTTTTTTEKSVAIAIPVPIPMPVQVAVPAFAPAFCVASPRAKSCPPCPPCLCMPQCTPAFFSYCSPCHLKCRCLNPGDSPIPLPPVPPLPVPGPAYPIPVPMPAGPPVVVVPVPPHIQYRQRRRKARPSSTSEESSDSSDCDQSRRFKRRRLSVLRTRGSFDSDDELVKPLLTYVSNNGDVKYERRISNDEAERLLGESDARRYKNVKVMTRDGEQNNQQVVVVSNDDNSHGRYKQVVLRGGVSSHLLSSGRKELVFKPPDNKRISNLSVSFQIA